MSQPTSMPLEDEIKTLSAKGMLYFPHGGVQRQKSLIDPSCLVITPAYKDFQVEEVHTFNSVKDEQEFLFEAHKLGRKALSNYIPSPLQNDLPYDGGYLSKVSQTWIVKHFYESEDEEICTLSSDALSVLQELSCSKVECLDDEEMEIKCIDFIKTYGSHFSSLLFGGSVLKIVRCFKFPSDDRKLVNDKLDNEIQKLSKQQDPPISTWNRRKKYMDCAQKTLDIQYTVLTIPHCEDADSVHIWENIISEVEACILIPEIKFPKKSTPVWEILEEIEDMGEGIEGLKYQLEMVCAKMISGNLNIMYPDIPVVTGVTNISPFHTATSTNVSDIVENGEYLRQKVLSEGEAKRDTSQIENDSKTSFDEDKSVFLSDAKMDHSLTASKATKDFKDNGEHNKSSTKQGQISHDFIENRPHSPIKSLQSILPGIRNDEILQAKKNNTIFEELMLGKEADEKLRNKETVCPVEHVFDTKITTRELDRTKTKLDHKPIEEKPMNMRETTDQSMTRIKHVEKIVDTIPHKTVESTNKPISKNVDDIKISRKCEIKNIMREFKIGKKQLGIKDVLTVRQHHLTMDNEKVDIVGKFITAITSLDYRGLVQLSGTYRDYEVVKCDSSSTVLEMFSPKKSSINTQQDNSDTSSLDKLFVILNCCDPFLLQEICTKLAACQLAVPLLLPDLYDDNLWFRNWALSGIIKNWKMYSGEIVMEESVMKCTIPVISFVRMGNIQASKSNIINKILGPVQGNDEHAYFLSKEQDSLVSKWSKGTVEAAWLTPKGKENASQVASSAKTILNLRGDVLMYPKQKHFLCAVSSAIVLFVEENNCQEHIEEIKELKKNSSTLMIVLNAKDMSCQTQQCSADIVVHENLIKLDAKGLRNFETAKLINSIVNKHVIPNVTNLNSLEFYKDLCDSLKIKREDSVEEFVRAEESVNKILESATSLKGYKKRVFPLQTQFWKEWASINKSKSRIPPQITAIQHFHSETDIKQNNIRKKQTEKGMSEELILLYRKIQFTSKIERQILLARLQSRLNEMSRLSLRPVIKELKDVKINSRQISSKIKAERGKEKSQMLGAENEAQTKTRIKTLEQENEALRTKTKEITKTFDEISIGLEHFVREFGQVYECHKQVHPTKGLVIHNDVRVDDLPSMIANLMLDGQHLEIFDGDAAHVPVTWVNGVLNALKEKIGDVKLFVISVIGIQSSGKSTLLNSMFGARFAVSAGRCTRGVFIQLLKVEDTLKDCLQCDYLVIVDTEGLRAPERAIMDTNEEDNELATFALCLSDLTLINIGGQTIGEDMTNVLEIAAHAFIRMKEVNLTTECRLVQQFVADTTAVHRNETSTQSILVKLDEATSAAAREEGRESQYHNFSDIFNLKLEVGANEDLQYIPSLWRGSMAPPNQEYSETVLRLKSAILRDIKSKTRKRWKLSQFRQRINDVWDAIKEEDFIFTFQNTVAALLYIEFQRKYSKWISKMRNENLKWVLNATTQVKNTSTENISDTVSKLCIKLEENIESHVENVKSNIRECMKQSAKDADNLRKQEHYFQNDLKHIANELLVTAKNNLRQAADYIQNASDIAKMLPKVMQTLISQVHKIACKIRQMYVLEGRDILSDISCFEGNIKHEFEDHWKDIVKKIHTEYPQQHITSDDIKDAINQCLISEVGSSNISKELKIILSDGNFMEKHFYGEHDEPNFEEILQRDKLCDINTLKIFIKTVKASQSEKDRTVQTYSKENVEIQIAMAVNFVLEISKKVKVSSQMLFSVLMHLCGWTMQSLHNKIQHELFETLMHSKEEREMLPKDEPITPIEIEKEFLKSMKDKFFSECYKKDLFKILDKGGLCEYTPNQNKGFLERFMPSWFYNTISGKLEICKEVVDEMRSFLREEILGKESVNIKSTILLFCVTLKSYLKIRKVSNKYKIPTIVSAVANAIEQIARYQRNIWGKKCIKDRNFDVMETEKLFISYVKEVLKVEPLFQDFQNDLKSDTMIKYARAYWNATSCFRLDYQLVNDIPCQDAAVYRRLETIVRNSFSYLETNMSKDIRFNKSIVKNLIGSTIDQLRKTPDVGQGSLPAVVIAHVVSNVCSCAFPLFVRFQAKYEREHSLLQIVSREKSRMYDEFKTMCNSSCLDSIVAEKVYVLLEKAVSEGVKNYLCTAVIEEIRTTFSFFNNRTYFLGHILEEMCEKKICSDYVDYLQNHEQFVTDWIFFFVAKACAAKAQKTSRCESLVNYLARTSISESIRKVEKAIREATDIIPEKHKTEVPEKDSDINVHSQKEMFCSWLDKFAASLKRETDFSCQEDEINMLKAYPVVNFTLFENELVTHVKKRLGKTVLSKLIIPPFDKAKEIEHWLRQLPIAPHEELKNHVKSPCAQKCPFCKALCDNPLNDHETHSSTIHYPTGITGWHNSRTKNLLCSICSSDVASETKTYRRCRPRCEQIPCGHEKLYKEYRKEHPNWSIQAITNTEPTKYWKWVFRMFNTEFAEYHDRNKCEIPEAWECITQEEALESLRSVYNMGTKKDSD